MNYIPRFFSKALASLMLAGLCLCFAATKSVAQCPPDIGGTGVGWTGPVTGHIYNIAGTTCTATILFCYRIVGGAEQIYIEEIDPDYTNTDCLGLTWPAIINDMREQMFQSVITSDCNSTNPCSGNLLSVVTLGNAQCFKMVLNATGTGANLVFCGDAFCTKTCSLCRKTTKPNEGSNIECNCTFSSLGTANCEATPNNFGSTLVTSFHTNDNNTQSWPWTPNVCFTVNCPSN